MKKELFEDIRIYDRKGKKNIVTKGASSLGWKFNYKGTQYGNYIDNAIYEKPDKYEPGMLLPIVGTRDIKPEEQIELFGKMIELMKNLIKK